MPIVADAAVAMRGDFSKFSGDLKKAETQTQGLGAKLKGALSPGALFGAVGGAFAVAGVINVLGDAVAAASNFGETLSKTSQIFGDEMMPELEKWADASAEAFGISQQSALDAASTFATFGKSAGLAGDELVGFSTGLTELAADLASFYNTSPEDAILAIGAALRGESEPIRRYGVLLDDATLRQRALKLGIIQTISQALTPQQKVLAAQAEIFAQTGDAQGDFARTSDGLAGQQKILAARLADVQVELGEKLLPIMVKLTGFLVDNVVPAMGFLAENADKVALIIGALLVPAIYSMAVAIGTATLAAAPWLIAIAAIAAAVYGIVQGVMAAQRVITDLALTFGDMGDKVHATADEVGVSFDEMKTRVKHNMVDMGMSFDDAVAAAKRGGSGMTDTWATAWSDVAATTTVGGQIIVGQAATIPGDVAGAFVAGAPVVAEGAETGLVEPTQKQLEAAEKAAVESARKLTGDYAAELAGGADKVKQGWEDLLSGAKDEQTKAERIASIHAKLTSKRLTDALHSEDPYLRAQAIAYRETLETELDTLSTNAIYQAWLTGEAVPDAVNANKQAAQDAAIGMRRRVVKALQMTEQARTAGANAGEAYAKALAASIATHAWLITIKVNDILATLTGTNSPPFTAFKKGAAGAAKAYIDSLNKGLQDARLGALMGSVLSPRSMASVGFGAAAVPGAGVASKTYQVNVLDAGVARSVGDIGRGLRELGETGQLP